MNTNNFSTALKAANEKNQNLMDSLIKDNIFEPIADDEVRRKVQEMDTSFSNHKPADLHSNIPKSHSADPNYNNSVVTKQTRGRELRMETVQDKLLVLTLKKQSELLQKEHDDLRKRKVQLKSINENNTQKIEDLLRKVAELESVVAYPQESLFQNEEFESDPEFWKQNEELNLIALQNQSIMSQNKEALRKLNSDAIRIKQMLISMSHAQFWA